MDRKFNEDGYTLLAYEARNDNEVIPLCAACYSEEVGEVSAGDEGWTVCQSCQSVEQGYVYIHESELDEF